MSIARAQRQVSGISEIRVRLSECTEGTGLVERSIQLVEVSHTPLKNRLKRCDILRVYSQIDSICERKVGIKRPKLRRNQNDISATADLRSQAVNILHHCGAALMIGVKSWAKDDDFCARLVKNLNGFRCVIG